MISPVLPTDEEGESIGTILFVLNRNMDGKQEMFYGHTGSQKGFQAFLYLYPDQKKAALFNMNTEIWGADNTSDLSRDVLYQIRELVLKYLAGN